MGKKGSMPSFKTIDDYIAIQAEETREILHELRAIIKEAAPDAVELTNYKIPSFSLIPGIKPEQQIMIAAYAKHVSFYPFQAATEHFADDLKGFDLGKGTVKFSYNKPLPKELIIRMVQFRKDEILNAANKL
jgi:uncharacterized protein YdhG (YjbR/CyaY superfamily)